MLRALSLTLALAALSWTAFAQAPLRDRMLAVEDARDAGPAGVAVLKEALSSRDAAMRRIAVRAIGRFEQPQLIDLIVPALADADAGVRQEAANAAGQAAVGAEAIVSVHGRLLRRLQAEQDPATWGVVAATLGRLRYERSEHVSAAESALRRVLPPPVSGAAVRAGAEAPRVSVQRDAVLGAVKGFEALFRQSRKLLPPSSDTIGQLRAVAVLRVTGDDVIARARRLAWSALTSADGVDAPLVEAGLDDPDGEVRRLALVAAGNAADLAGREALLRRGLADAHAPARYEALRAWGRHLQARDCAPVTAAVNDADGHVALLAIDLLGEGCPGGVAPVSLLHALADPMPTAPAGWHRAAHAAVALAKASPDDGRDLLPRMLAHPTWQVRMYAARVAGAASADDALVTLARDRHDNVREAALTELVSRRHDEAVALAIEALGRPDYQLVRTAARSLHNRSHRERAVPPLVAALARVTGERRDTSRDARLAILDALGELGWPDGAGLTAAQIDALRGYTSDFDRRVAARAAELLQIWTKAPQASHPQPLPLARVPWAEVEALGGVTARVTMAGRGVFELRFFADEAPMTVHRVVTLARRGYYDGLTFHRVVPNFVIQGGSPGANEYVGDGPYMRDEVGLRSHRRGTLGISTRGRDTGDAQIFVNLVDLPRLDHGYTVFAEVTRGMDVVDAILEGDVIERFEILP